MRFSGGVPAPPGQTKERFPFIAFGALENVSRFDIPMDEVFRVDTLDHRNLRGARMNKYAE